MILKSPENRQAIKDYLSELSEDELIDNIIEPIFSNYGFRVYRRLTHGPGEHGADVIFVRYDTLHQGEEFISVQAKAEQATADNVRTFVNQIERALTAGFVTSKGNQKPHYAFFMNSRHHTNDATVEMQQMLDRHTNVRVFAQEQMRDLIMDSGVAPKDLLDQLNQSSVIDEHDINLRILKTLTENKPKEVDHLLDDEVPLLRQEVSPRMREMIIDFANKKWKDDGTWDGTVRPMKWYKEYFEFFNSRQFPYLARVIEEYASSNPSYAASSDTYAVFKKIRPTHIKTFAKDFVSIASRIIGRRGNQWEDIADLVIEVWRSKVISDPKLDAMVEYIHEYRKDREERDSELLKDLRDEFDPWEK